MIISHGHNSGNLKVCKNPVKNETDRKHCYPNGIPELASRSEHFLLDESESLLAGKDGANCQTQVRPPDNEKTDDDCIYVVRQTQKWHRKRKQWHNQPKNNNGDAKFKPEIFHVVYNNKPKSPVKRNIKRNLKLKKTLFPGISIHEKISKSRISQTQK